jgi:hypothetical protein
MMKSILFMFTVLCLAAGPVSSQTRDSSLTEIELSYISGQYLSAELDARRLLEQSGLTDSVKIQLEKWIAFSLIAQGKSGAAKERFITLLQMDDTFELDPVLTSPKILYVFNEARSAFIARRKNIAADSLKNGWELQGRSGRTISFRTILFPGWEQLHQGRRTEGYLFATAGAVTFASGIVMEFLRSNARQDYLQARSVNTIASAYDRYDTYRKAEYYSFGAFIAVYILSEADVFLRSDVTIQQTTSRFGDHSLQFSFAF